MDVFRYLIVHFSIFNCQELFIIHFLSVAADHFPYFRSQVLALHELEPVQERLVDSLLAEVLEAYLQLFWYGVLVARVCKYDDPFLRRVDTLSLFGERDKLLRGFWLRCYEPARQIPNICLLLLWLGWCDLVGQLELQFFVIGRRHFRHEPQEGTLNAVHQFLHHT